jgi:predicted small secreted protein
MEEKLMLTFILGVAIGACTTVITISLMVVAKNADQQMELMMPKE